ncbi:MAG: hypothetical protein MUC28_01945, partial [Planctomycetes bacterium]|nr:hypothetical protein [Planctomycetota bacterium]
AHGSPRAICVTTPNETKSFSEAKVEAVKFAKYHSEHETPWFVVGSGIKVGYKRWVFSVQYYL